MKEIKLGAYVRDLMSGFEGVAYQKAEYLSGNVQYAVQPKCKGDGAYPEAMFIDVHMLIESKDGLNDVSEYATKPVDTNIKLGNYVEDIATGFRGFVVSKITHINGCVSFGVTPKAKKKNTMPDVSLVSSVYLNVLDDGIDYLANVGDETKEITGGPAVSARNVVCR